MVQPAAGRGGALTTLLKFVHIATIAIWAAGLIVLPYLFRQRRLLAVGPELDRLHRITRFVYLAMTSPAAFVAIGSGTALIFFQGTFREWFTLKMVLVGLMVMLHVVAGLVAMRVFAADGRFGARSYVALTVSYLVLIVAILWVVLAKPAIDAAQIAPGLFEPGALKPLVRQIFGATSTPTP
ncbi:MAG TPA: CopD family protein [Casimicrobiaceae bacterium]|nr:CopD family protein [Casimicrobiaceae bacterium]